MCDCSDLQFPIFMCDCDDDGVCEIVTIWSLQYLCVIVVCIQEVFPSLSFENDEMMTVSNNQMVVRRQNQ